MDNPESAPPGSPEDFSTAPPPTARQWIQLFLVPAGIVVACVLVLLGISWMTGLGQSDLPSQRLEQLRSHNPEIRWRAASDLAQILKRDPALAAQPEFGLRLADLTQNALRDLQRLDQERLEHPAGSQAGAREQHFLAQRGYVQFLINCLGNLRTPVGIPVLAGGIMDPPVREEISRALVQRQCVWALASLGHQLGAADPGLRTVQGETFATLARGSGTQAALASMAQDIAQGRRPNPAIAALLVAAQAEDPFLRQLAAHALGFWPGTPEEARAMEAMLVRLSQDEGQGRALAIPELP